MEALEDVDLTFRLITFIGSEKLTKGSQIKTIQRPKKFKKKT